MENETRGVVTRYFSAWTAKRVDEAYGVLAGDLRFWGPTASYDSAAAFRPALENFAAMASAARMLTLLVEGNRAAMLYDCDLPQPVGTVKIASFFEVRDRKIVAYQTLFDATELRKLAAPMEMTMSDGQMAPETKGVTAKLLATVDLGREIEGMAGRQLRMRMVTIDPGGVFGPIHDHKDRPGIVYILQGTITDHRNGVATDYGPGVGWPEDRNTMHWLENRGPIPAVEISVDIVRQE